MCNLTCRTPGAHPHPPGPGSLRPRSAGRTSDPRGSPLALAPGTPDGRRVGTCRTGLSPRLVGTPDHKILSLLNLFS